MQAHDEVMEQRYWQAVEGRDGSFDGRFFYGVLTTGVALKLGERYGVELPITTQMAEVLNGRTDVRTAIEVLMLRRQRAEAETG